MGIWGKGHRRPHLKTQGGDGVCGSVGTLNLFSYEARADRLRLVVGGGSGGELGFKRGRKGRGVTVDRGVFVDVPLLLKILVVMVWVEMVVDEGWRQFKCLDS